MDPVTEDELRALNEDRKGIEDVDGDNAAADDGSTATDREIVREMPVPHLEDDSDDDDSDGEDEDDQARSTGPGQVTPEANRAAEGEDEGSVSSDSVDEIFREIRGNLSGVEEDLRPVRSRIPPERLTYDHHHQTDMSEQEWAELEASHNINTDEIDESLNQEYTLGQALIAC